MTTALMLIDVINDFFHPKGRNYHDVYDPILKRILVLLKAARQANAPIFHVMEGHQRGPSTDFEWKKLPEHCFLGDFDAEPAAGVDVREGAEYIVRKRRYSGFFATDLDLLLREAGVTRIVIVGVKTHVCVRATAQDALGYGYDVIVPREAVGSNYAHLHEASLEDIDRYMGRVEPFDEALALFSTNVDILTGCGTPPTE
ncbi:MAG: cysteine hydrolase family protein [Anaerolineae bacterium]